MAAKGIELNFMIHWQDRKLSKSSEWDDFFCIVVVVQMEQFLDLCRVFLILCNRHLLMGVTLPGKQE